jgi:hypothetical protein
MTPKKYRDLYKKDSPIWKNRTIFMSKNKNIKKILF